MKKTYQNVNIFQEYFNKKKKRSVTFWEQDLALHLLLIINNGKTSAKHKPHFSATPNSFKKYVQFMLLF